jgi:hypothetical protein
VAGVVYEDARPVDRQPDAVDVAAISGSVETAAKALGGLGIAWRSSRW